jgi:hypothetical protein
VTNTEFEKRTLEEIFTINPDKIPKWRIGEALGEFFLQEHFKIRFWHNQLRDLRNPDCSPGGADLLGFVGVDQEIIFVFGETKTSEDENSPPQVLYGRTGLRRQIVELRNNERKRNSLIRYLAFKVKPLPVNVPFRKDFDSALETYIKSGKKRMHIMGLLVRDTECNENDLRPLFENYEHDVDEPVILTLIGLYIPLEMEEWKSVIGKGGAT